MKYQYYATKISENLSETPEGYLLAVGVPIGRLGEMEYGRGETPIEPGSNGIALISRSEEELFRPETIASFNGKPFTIGHPNDFVDANNWSTLAKGVLQNVRRGSGETKDDLVADILITDSTAISLVKGGTRQLSCGYECEYEPSGDGKGIQKNIVGNHLALVEEGRAGDAYAINDEKGVFRMNKKLKEQIKALFGKALDEAPSEESKPEESKDAQAYDELVQLVKDLSSKVEKMGQPQDKKDDPKPDASGEVVADEPVEASLEDRLKAVEAKLAALLESKSVNDGGEEEEVVLDASPESEEPVEDEEIEMTADEKSRVEILAPGLEATKDFKVQALKKAYATADGKAAIEVLSGGVPDFKAAGKVEMLFVGASEVLKSTRGKQLANTKRTQDFTVFSNSDTAMTAEKMNELNAKHYNRSK